MMPITPSATRALTEQSEFHISACVEIVNRLLTMPVHLQLLWQGKEVEIYDSSNWEVWQASGVQTVQRFIDAGWIVRRRIVEKTTVYYFSLPKE